MKIPPAILMKCSLFKDIDEPMLSKVLTYTSYHCKDYSRNAVIAMEGDNCNALGIVLSGRIELQKAYASGKIVTLEQMTSGNMFGEAIVFTDNHQYPALIKALEKTEILYISQADIIRLCSEHTLFLKNFMELLSNRILMLNKRIKDLSFSTIRQKLANYLLEEYKHQQNLTLKIPFSKQTLAEHMGIQRPSLSRELIKMREEGLLAFHRNTISILNLTSLEELTY